MFIRLPVMLSISSGGACVAQLLAGPAFEALGANAEQAMRTLKARVRRTIKSNHWAANSVWASAELSTRTFPVLPVVVHADRRYPAGPKVDLPVRYLRLEDQRGELFCLLPDFGEMLFCPNAELFKSTLFEAVRAITALLTPAQLRKLWPPKQSELRWLRVRIKEVGSGVSGKRPEKTLSWWLNHLLRASWACIWAPVARVRGWIWRMCCGAGARW